MHGGGGGRAVIAPTPTSEAGVDLNGVTPLDATATAAAPMVDAAATPAPPPTNICTDPQCISETATAVACGCSAAVPPAAAVCPIVNCGDTPLPSYATPTPAVPCTAGNCSYTLPCSTPADVCNRFATMQAQFSPQETATAIAAGPSQIQGDGTLATECRWAIPTLKNDAHNDLANGPQPPPPSLLETSAAWNRIADELTQQCAPVWPQAWCSDARTYVAMGLASHQPRIATDTTPEGRTWDQLWADAYTRLGGLLSVLCR